MSAVQTRHLADRRADLAAIHIAKKALGLDDDAYRDLLQTICSVRSSADLDVSGRKRWLAHLQACMTSSGLKSSKPRTGSAPRKPLTARQRLIWSLWHQLADAGLVKARTGAAVTAFIKRQTQVDRLEWLNPQQEDLVIVSLRQWLKRGGPESGA